jgi:aspartate kinase
VVVVSAMAGETNRLLDLASQINPDALAREMDVLVSTGEQVTIALLSMALHKRDIEARSYTGGQVRILTDSIHGKARIRDIDTARVRTDLELNRVVVVAGFQGVDDDGNITTLGRGGSDTTAVAMAAALEADECRIFTDVDGVYTADPRIVPEARRLDQITVEEMLELASQGAKVLQTRSVEFAGKYHVPLRVLSSFEDGPGTLITHEVSDMEQPLISGIAYNRDEAKVTIRSHSGVAAMMFETLATEGINIELISTSEIKISVGVNDKYLELAVRALHKAFGLDGEGTEEQLAEATDI